MRKIVFVVFIISLSVSVFSQPKPEHNLQFNALAKRWDEAIPLGNGWLGALIWQKDTKLRMSLDRVDLWDDRPMPEIDKLKFSWVKEKVRLNQYDSVQKIGDEPYEKFAAPTKIPATAIEINIASFGKIRSAYLDIKTAIATIQWESGAEMETYVSAVSNNGIFILRNAPSDLDIDLIPPSYNSGNKGLNGSSVEGQGLERLGYKKGSLIKNKVALQYFQPCYGTMAYVVTVNLVYLKNEIRGNWSVTNTDTKKLTAQAESFDTTKAAHIKWWSDYWSRSSVSLPDTILEKQYYLDMYKFGCVARSNTPPISLQAIWTADNGNLPPWKGDFHHDLNTQLSYWPGYTGNHLDLTASFTNWLWKIKEENKRWTKHYFGVDGLNVPGVTTISGKAMGGWIQYSMSPTAVAWLAQHFYWQWQYSRDEKFLKEKCGPYLKDAEIYIAKMMTQDNTAGKLTSKMALSSSPEFNDNSINAWFNNFTNFDLALVKSLYSEKEKISLTVKDKGELLWSFKKAALPGFDTNQTGLTISKGQNLDASHRHHSHLMAIYPLQLLNVDDSAQKNIIDRSLRRLEQKGTRQWCGYSFSWAACIYARAKEADSAVSMLRKFATNFCSINSFHLNGDQKGGQYSDFTYRPFTLEGNFAFAQGIHELLLQSSNGYIEVFPAVPSSWKDVSFTTLRTEGAFLVSAKKESGLVTEVKITAEQGGLMELKLPFKTWFIEGAKPANITTEKGIVTATLRKGQTVVFKNGYE